MKTENDVAICGLRTIGGIVALGLVTVALITQGHCQTVVFGNSEVQFAPWQYSGIPNLTARGHKSLTCAELRPWLPGDVPEGTVKVALVLGTNDVRTGVLPLQHMACVLGMVKWLQQNRPGIEIRLANVPPWGQNPPPPCSAPAWVPHMVEQYNQLYALIPYLPLYRGVKVVDIWSAIVQQDGWAILADMDGPCYIHFDQPQQWPSQGWAFFMGQIAAGLQ